MQCKVLLDFKFDFCDHNPSALVLSCCFNAEQENKGVSECSCMGLDVFFIADTRGITVLQTLHCTE